MGAAGAVAAAARRAERQIIDHLRLCRALEPSSAVEAPALQSFAAERRLGRLEAAGVVRRTVDGRVYLDEHAFVAWRDGQRRRALVAVLVLAVLLAGALAFGVFPSAVSTP